MIVQFECAEREIIPVLEVIRKLAKPSTIQLLDRRNIPSLPSEKIEENERSKKREEDARRIAHAIAPRPWQKTRQMALDYLFNDDNGFQASRNDQLPSLRNAIGAVSKALRKFDRDGESPLDILCRRERQLSHDGPNKGHYVSTEYRLTPLGKRVREILRSNGHLKT